MLNRVIFNWMICEVVLQENLFCIYHCWSNHEQHLMYQVKITKMGFCRDGLTSLQVDEMDNSIIPFPNRQEKLLVFLFFFCFVFVFLWCGAENAIFRLLYRDHFSSVQNQEKCHF